ncbi:MAG: cytochrome c553 [Gammaproteobacteria bacterium]|jgi:cytochrome c553
MRLKRFQHALFTSAVCALFLGASQAVVAAGNIERGKAKSVTCQACHGPTGNSENAAFPKIAGQYRSYLLHAMRAYATGERTNPIMQGMAAPLSEQDREDLAAWFSSQKGLNPLQSQH